MKLNFKNIFTMISVIGIILSLSSLTAFAYWEHPVSQSYCVEIYNDQTYTYSACLTDPYVYFEGRNTSLIKKLDFIPQYYNGNAWVDDASYRVSADSIIGKTSTTHRASNTQHRLKLSNTSSITTGATGYGWIW